MSAENQNFCEKEKNYLVLFLSLVVHRRRGQGPEPLRLPPGQIAREISHGLP